MKFLAEAACLSSVQEQAKSHSSQGTQCDDHQEFEASPHRPLLGVASFDGSQHESRQRGESIGPPSGLRQREQHWQRWDEATNDEGDPDLDTFQPRINMGVFDYSQFVMHHCLVPAFSIARQMPHDLIEQRATEAFLTVDGSEFGPFLLRLMFHFVALCGNAALKDLPGCSCRQIASQSHRDPSGQYLTQHDQQEPCGCNLADRHDEDQGRDQAVVNPEDYLAQPISSMRMLFFARLYNCSCVKCHGFAPRLDSINITNICSITQELKLIFLLTISRSVSLPQEHQPGSTRRN